MAISGNVYSPKSFELLIAPQTTLGTAHTTSGDFRKYAVTSVSDIDFGSGLVADRTLRIGQQIKKNTDHYASQKGASCSFSFEWLVDGEEALQNLLLYISEDASSAYVRAGNQAPLVYNDGDSTGKFATIVISNPNTDDDRVMHSAVLTELTLSMDSGSSGGRLTASGTFYSGFKPLVQQTNTVTGTANTAYVKSLFDCVYKRLGDISSANYDVVVRSLSLTIGYPAARIGYDAASASGEAGGYSRAGEYTASGEISVKYDDNISSEINHLLSPPATARGIIVGDASSPTAIGFKFAQVVYTGFNLDMDEEAGTFVTISFDCVADGAENVYEITAT
jgi:hypothetical protein|tara:strand:+ start:3750 stop:4757 length:1008 start_codon:yes stop_codon:yes gene_type:complete